MQSFTCTHLLPLATRPRVLSGCCTSRVVGGSNKLACSSGRDMRCKHTTTGYITQRSVRNTSTFSASCSQVPTRKLCVSNYSVFCPHRTHFTLWPATLIYPPASSGFFRLPSYLPSSEYFPFFTFKPIAQPQIQRFHTSQTH